MLQLDIKHGNQRLRHELSPQATLGDLLSLLEESTGVPAHCQRLIFNGRTLNSPDTTHDQVLGKGGLELPAKARILVLGKKPEETDPEYGKIMQLDKKCVTATQKLNDIEKDIEDMEKGYAPKELIVQQLPKFEKQLHLVAEEMMQVLEAADGIVLKESQRDARAKRKGLVDRVHNLHKRGDDLMHRVRNLHGKN